MCDACIKAAKALGPYTSALNPEPDQVALARYRRLVERGELPKPSQLPAWLRAHLSANYVKPLVHDYRQRTPSGDVWPWKEAAHVEPDEPFVFVSLLGRK